MLNVVGQNVAWSQQQEITELIQSLAGLQCVLYVVSPGIYHAISIAIIFFTVFQCDH